MLTTPAELQAYRDQCQARFATPDFRVEIHNGREWHRAHPMRCPWCGAIFYGWKPVDVDMQPHQIEPPPPPGGASRATCGNPLCWKAEDGDRWNDVLRSMKRLPHNPEEEGRHGRK